MAIVYQQRHGITLLNGLQIIEDNNKIPIKGVFNLFENEMKITDLKSGDNIYILFERDNPDYYIFLKSKEEVKKIWIESIKN